ncbi:zeta toxin family protein [Spirosoma foliorum]|uniref:Zeta toxin family protein n=1 Tax=Spirosoma foliorum TaxID=2710596 RepID=A0A7G5GT22_9BACT|nr:zeta toxin family protein [Spirosoma foliorum]QMW02014.1 zeta toxin family protein [Spirosoma foliorum]
MIRRLRMFAGPNGSGKSTVKSVIAPELLGTYLNPDDIEKEVRRDGYYDLRGMSLSISQAEIIDFFNTHPLSQRTDQIEFIDGIRLIENEFIDFGNVGFNSYLSAILTDYLRQKLIDAGQSFTFETVMSSADKLQTLRRAQAVGFRNYLYYVATEDPLINIARIRHRVRTGGHPVPDDKVTERYHRSLALLLDAIRLTNRAYIFDNSGQTKVWIAEISEGVHIELKTDLIPNWFSQSVLAKL